MKITGSTLPLLASCQWWARDNVEAPSRAANAAMMVGTEVHAAIEKTILGEAVGDLSDDARDYYDTWLSWWQQDAKAILGDGKLDVETAYAYSPQSDTGRCLGRVIGRNYPATESNEIVGTVDALMLKPDCVTVIDWKTGDDRAGMIADASSNKQLRGYALAATRAHNVESARVMIVRIGSQGVSVTDHTLDALDLAVAANDLREQIAKVATAVPQPGTHCSRCRAVAVCPATAKATDELVPQGPSPEPIPLVITQENAGPLLTRLSSVRAACDALEDALRAFADANGSFALDNGKSWGKVTTERSSIKLDGPEGADAISVIEASGLMSAVETTARTSRAAIERAVKSQGLKGKEASGRVQALMDELRRIGAIRTTLVASYKEQ